MSLHEILDFTGLPKKLRDMVADYKINLIDIRKFIIKTWMKKPLT